MHEKWCPIKTSKDGGLRRKEIILQEEDITSIRS
jgi:hypothetical protein